VRWEERSKFRKTATDGAICAICGITASNSPTKRLVIDHDHGSKEIRGFLCDRCNAYVYLFEREYYCFPPATYTKQSYLDWVETYNSKLKTYFENTKILEKFL